jgi:hypothetical protein
MAERLSYPCIQIRGFLIVVETGFSKVLVLQNFTSLSLLIDQDHVSLGACFMHGDPNRHVLHVQRFWYLKFFDVGEGISVPTSWLLYQFQDQKNAPSVTVPMGPGGGGTCARFGNFRKIADIPGSLCSVLAKEENKLYVET